MTDRLTRLALAATVLGTLFVPAVTSVAGPEDELEKTEEKLEEVRERIDSGEAEADDLQANIDSLNDQIIGLRNDVADLDTQIAKIESQVRSVQERIDGIQAKIDGILGDATKQAVRLYKDGGFGPLEALLDSESLSELDARLEFYGTVAQENTSALVKLSRLRSEIRVAEKDLFDKKEELTAVRSEQERVLADLDGRYDTLAIELAALEEQLGEAHAQEGDLEDKAGELKEIIIERQAQGSVEVLGVSAAGYIWPLNGPLNSPYGPRWGRMHTGIDIGGNAGQPLVASNSGRVILAGYNGGYGNCVIIDHGGGVSTLYAHMTQVNVANGQNVAQGAIIGTVGCTGSCTGDHVHFEVRVNGSPVDPLGYLP